MSLYLYTADDYLNNEY